MGRGVGGGSGAGRTAVAEAPPTVIATGPAEGFRLLGRGSRTSVEVPPSTAIAPGLAKGSRVLLGGGSRGFKPVHAPRGARAGSKLGRASHEEEPPEEEGPSPPTWAAWADFAFLPLLRRPLRDLGWAVLPLNAQDDDEGVQPRLLH